MSTRLKEPWRGERRRQADVVGTTADDNDDEFVVVVFAAADLMCNLVEWNVYDWRCC